MPFALPRSAAVAVALALLVGTTPGAAQAPGEVELSTSISFPDLPVPGAPTDLGFHVTNTGDAAATNVELVAQLPVGVSIVQLESVCTATPGPSGTTVTCPFDALGPNIGTGFGVWVEFATLGTYPFAADVTADQPDADGHASSSAEVTVVEEEADLYGDLTEVQVLAGETELIRHLFWSNGPTSFAGATISGTFPAGVSVLPGTFSFGYPENRAAEDCTVTSTGYTCGPVWGDTIAPHDADISYWVAAPATAGTHDATATITGRNDPVPSNNSSTVRIVVREPAADLYASLSIARTWNGQQTWDVPVNAWNLGELPATDVAATLAVPAGWTVGLPTDPDPPGRSCSVASDGRSVTCTYDEVGPAVATAFFAPVTSPAGPSTPGSATLTLSTPTPERGDLPNVDTAELRHYAVVVTVTPSTGLDDGQLVDVQVTDFPTSRQLGSVICTAPLVSLANCDLATLRYLSSDASGSALLSRSVSRFIVTAEGITDCATDECALVVGTLDQSSAGSAPISFGADPPPSSGVGVTLGAPAYLSRDPVGPATIPATLTCTEAVSAVAVEFVLAQPSASGGATMVARSTVTVPCSPDAPVAIASDLLGTSFAPGAADVLVRATAGTGRVAFVEEITLEAAATVLAALQARLADPNDTTVLPELIAGLLFRLQYNPRFALEFWRAILAPPP